MTDSHTPHPPGQYEAALECFGRSLNLNKEYEKARSWQQKLLAETAEAEQQRQQQQQANGNGHAGIGAAGGEASSLEPPEVGALSLTSEGVAADARVAGVGTVAMQEEGEEGAITMLT